MSQSLYIVKRVSTTTTYLAVLASGTQDAYNKAGGRHAVLVDQRESAGQELVFNCPADDNLKLLGKDIREPEPASLSDTGAKQ